MLKINNITIEGPDLAGKTTLYNKIHKDTGFKWNIQDRSVFSMLCYSLFYKRGDEDRWRQLLHETISCLNNRTIILLPSWDLIRKRYSMRGDEVQTLSSLERVYDIFQTEAKKIEDYATVKVLRPFSQSEFDYDAISAMEWLNDTDKYSTNDVSEEIKTNVSACSALECSPLNFELTFNNPEDLVEDHSIMLHPAEEVYYANILHKVMKNIQDEIAGNNEYQVPQSVFSTRRFVFTQDSCISMVHTMIRARTMTMHVVCRSSDVEKTFEYDLRFLSYLFGRVYKKLQPSGVSNFRMKVALNSAHIIAE